MWYIIIKERELKETQGGKKMFKVYMYDDGMMDDVMVMQGTLATCQQYVATDDTGDDLFIVAPDGFTVVD
jgi:hypothetical protein